MQRATISEIKSRLSAYLKRVKAGETVLILDRNEPVARIEPVRPHDHPKAQLAAMAGKGTIRPGNKAVPLTLLRSRPPETRQSILDALLEERRRGR